MTIHEHADVKEVLAQIEAVNKAIVAMWEAISSGSINPLMDEKYRAAAVILSDRRKRLEVTLNETIADVAYNDAMRKFYPEE